MQSIGIKNIKYIGKQKTIDLEVDSTDHNFYSNGIVVSNSHSLATSYLTALTVYLKYKYPTEFYLACLKEIKGKPDSIEAISQINQELRSFGIKLLPPHILNSDIDFKVVGNDILFGLGSIKGISEKTIEKLNRFRHPHSNKFEIFAGAKEAGLSIGVLASLILVGSLDIQGQKRAKLVYEAQLFNILTPREKQLVIQFGDQFSHDLVKCLRHIRTLKNEKGKLLIKDSRYETIKKYEAPYKQMFEFNNKNEQLASYFFESRLLGYAYSVNLMEIYKPVAPDLMTIEEVNSCLEYEKVHFVGEAIKVVSKKGRESGQKYIRIEVQDHTGSCQVLLCNSNKYAKIEEHIEENERSVKEGDIVSIRGDKGKDIIFAKKIGIQECTIFEKISQLKNIKEEDIENK